MSDPQPPAHVGEQIKKRREEANLSISALATRAGVSKGYLWSLEKGESAARPSGRTLYRIAAALGTTMSDLLSEQLLVDFPNTHNIPDELAEFARIENLTESDVQMLRGVNFRGQHPHDVDGWRLVWGAIKASVR
jgi:transcriptional regulator with XRE-family HTH domain